MKQSILIVWMVTFTALFAGSVSAANATPLTTLSHAIISVQSTGKWVDSNGTAGTYRIVLLKDKKGGQSLHVQWLTSESAKTNKIPYTLEVTEIASLDLKIIGISAQASPRGDLSIYLEADVSEDPDAAYGYELFLVDRKSYSFGPASN